MDRACSDHGDTGSRGRPCTHAKLVCTAVDSLDVLAIRSTQCFSKLPSGADARGANLPVVDEAEVNARSDSDGTAERAASTHIEAPAVRPS